MTDMHNNICFIVAQAVKVHWKLCGEKNEMKNFRLSWNKIIKLLPLWKDTKHGQKKKRKSLKMLKLIDLYIVLHIS
jgi:hypothetical protein